MTVNLFFLGHTEQGVATTARLATRAAMAAGMKAQLYMPEHARPGNGRQAWLRLAKGKEPIEEKGPIAEPDFVVAFDARMIKEQLKSLKDRSVLIVNSEERFTNPILKNKKIRVISVDARGIAMTSTGRPFAAAPMAGALSKAFPKLSLKALKTAIESEFYSHATENKAAAEEGYKGAR